MRALRLDRLWDFFAGIELLVGLLWLGLAVLTVTLLVLMRTRWGQSRPLGKCVLLSLLAHLLLAGYATTVQIASAYPQRDEPVIHVSFVEDRSQQPAAVHDVEVEEKPWQRLPDQAIPPPAEIDPQRLAYQQSPEPQRPTQVEHDPLKGDPPLDHLTLAEAEQPEPQPPDVSKSTGRSSPYRQAGAHQAGAPSPEPIQVSPPQRREPAPPNLPTPAAPGRRTVPNAAEPDPVQTRSAGVPTALLEQVVPSPQLAAVVTTPDPADALSAATDRLERPARSEPASSAAVDPGHSVPGADTGHQGAEPPSGVGPPEPWQPLKASRGGSHASGDDAGLPWGDTGAIALPQRPRDRVPASGWGEDQPRLPTIYSLRLAPDRSRLAQRQGATSATEEAVKAALKWLADNQEPGGRWDADRHGAGREMLVAGRDRQRAGIQADTGMTGLALLAFLASGHTHREGLYRENVRQGLQYLLSVQAADGNLGGEATAFAAMYCHAMATCALSEAYGMTGDERLRGPVRRAIGYTIAAQDAAGGGFRYRPGDPGDTSQCGWQLMALKSAELAGIPMPRATRNGLIRFLRSVSAGAHGGLASYRPSEPVSRPMTAEALVCWQFLGMPREHPAGNEAGDYLLGELPGQGQANLYYWYYATLGMYQLQGTHWQRWNDALRATLLDAQRAAGPLAGSWDPSTVWGGYGGRVYTTALATLCLEVYYRFLPLYDHAAPAGVPTE